MTLVSGELERLEPMTDAEQPAGGPPAEPSPIPAEQLAELIVADRRCLFGPMFFLRHLGVLVRDRCPDPGERLPSVSLWLADGSTVDVCHIEMVSPRWVALAIRGASRPGRPMPLLLVPYETIIRVQIAEPADDVKAIGFDPARQPGILTDATAEQRNDSL